MQQPNVKYTITDGVITIAPGVERIEEGTFIEVDFKEMHVPASVKVLEYPLDLSEQLEADLYLYGSDTEIRFADHLSRIVKACIYVIPEHEPHYVEQLNQTHPAGWREVISVEAMPADRLHHYGVSEEHEAHAAPTPQQQAQLVALEADYRRLLADWEVQCAEPFAATLAELRAEEDTFKSSFKLVERRFWQFPFCDKPQPKKAHNRISFALQYGRYLEEEFNAVAKKIKANTAKVDALMQRTEERSISSATKRLQQLNDECQRLITDGLDKLHSLRIHIPDLRTDRPKLVAKPTFSFKRTLITIGILLCVCLPLIARFSSAGAISTVCLSLWAIVLIAFCIYLVRWLNDFILVIRHRSDGSLEVNEERKSKQPK
jgi:hypothetical protein